jgi:hypothetical protein
MKSIYIYIIATLSVLLISSCTDENNYPETFDVTNEYKAKLLGEWSPVEQQVMYYTKSYEPGRDSVVVFNESDFNNLSSNYYNGLYGLKIKVAENGTVINMTLKDDQSYSFGEAQLSGAAFHVVSIDGKIVIEFMKNESESSSVKQIERMPFTIISLSDTELVIGTKSDSQESVFTGTYNVTTGLPESQNRWCTHTITYRRK